MNSRSPTQRPSPGKGSDHAIKPSDPELQPNMQRTCKSNEKSGGDLELVDVEAADDELADEESLSNSRFSGFAVRIRRAASTPLAYVFKTARIIALGSLVRALKTRSQSTLGNQSASPWAILEAQTKLAAR